MIARGTLVIYYGGPITIKGATIISFGAHITSYVQCVTLKVALLIFTLRLCWCSSEAIPINYVASKLVAQKTQ